ncbi:MAG: hypothetical protein AAGU74_08385 [Bacillota bacterium]
MKERSSINEVNKVCKAVLKLTDEDFSEVEDMAKAQAAYAHPFKMATAAQQQEYGDHNMRVLAALRNLRDVIRAGEVDRE